MSWTVVFHDAFEDEFLEMGEPLQNELLAHAQLLQTYGPALGRPFVDTLKGSRHRNMKELRLTVIGGEWRIAFAFAPDRQAVILCAADKQGITQRRFYDRLITKADERLEAYIARLFGAKKG